MAPVALPGARWELEFIGNGSVEIERFVNSGDIYGTNMFSELFACYSDRADHLVSSDEAELMTLVNKIP